YAGCWHMGLGALNNVGLHGIFSSDLVYLIMDLGVFLVVVMIANATGNEEIDSYRGLAWRGAVLPAACLAVFLFSLTGLPPFAGFVGKFLLFAAVINEGGTFVILAVVAILNSVISLYYYSKIVKVMFLDTPHPGEKSLTIAGHNFTLLIPLTALTIVLGVYFSPLIYYTSQSLRFFMK